MARASEPVRCRDYTARTPPSCRSAVAELARGYAKDWLTGRAIGDLTGKGFGGIMHDDGRVSLALSGTPIRLREPLAGLALEVADADAARGSVWLFPSSQGNRPLSPEPLRERIAAFGLSRVLLVRNGAVGALAAQLPPALLADQLGLSLSTAAAWSKAVGAARGDYTALRGGR